MEEENVNNSDTVLEKCIVQVDINQICIKCHQNEYDHEN